MSIRVLIADDHAVVRQGLRTFLELQDGLEGDGDVDSPDELHFIVVHQVYELWFKLVLRSLRLARDRMAEPRVSEETVPYGEWGRVELTTLTQEFFMPRFLERDEPIRREPWDKYPWDGVGDVRPFGKSKTTIIEGVY